MARTALSTQEVLSHLDSLPGWTFLEGKLQRELIFDTFVDAFAFMTKAALVSERLNHHPNWSNSYNRVLIQVLTHDVNAVTETDLRWVREVNRFIEDNTPTTSAK